MIGVIYPENYGHDTAHDYNEKIVRELKKLGPAKKILQEPENHA